ncbi:MAG: CDP-glycerol glycerophosphotransferase family protein [Thermodesulfobacteriota bacterium]
MINKAAGLIYGPLEHHLDHVGIFCSLMQIPLVLTDEELLQKAQLYYPDLKTIYWNCLESPFEVVRAFDTIFYSTPRIMFDEVFFIAETTLRKKIRTIWLPHGNSDKGHASYFMEGLKDEEMLLVYGPKMVDFLKEKNVHSPCIQIGNFRLEYFRRHRAFYDALIARLRLPAKQIALYAPTWQDVENSTSFFETSRHLIETLPSNTLLLIKLHPNLEKEIRAEQLILHYDSHPSVRFLRGMTPVYPFLEKADLYLGDMSSIGYDFLSFNRPMYFFNPNKRDRSDPGMFLHRCGTTIDPEQYSKIFEIVEQNGAQSHLTQVRQATYAYTFGKDKPWNERRNKILKEIVKPLDIEPMDCHPHRTCPLP